MLRLTEGIERDRLAETVAEYVVTDALADSFDQALDLITAALRDRQSKAAFLAGSFGSGKSHFMAILYALLGRDPGARAIPQLASTIARHDGVLQDKRILRLAFHFLDAESMESVILGGYLDQIRALHPDCELPAVHRSDAVLADSDRLRATMGDDAFFHRLNDGAGGAGADDPWSSVLDRRWDADSYAAARAAGPTAADRHSLVSDLVGVYFTAYAHTASFVSLDEGLAAISSHARSLGYDAITLFCDELVLWLAFKVRDAAFFSREAQKITKLVEAQHERPIPLISIVARQLDLRRYFLESGGMGAEQDALDNAFRHQESRFATITLGDDNLPYVAQQRLLKPTSESARSTLDEAFARLERRPEVWDVLLDGVNTDEAHRGSDQQAFRRTYPFSPALVSTLRTLASAMQRDRTALKVMQQLLVSQRNTLTVDSVVPVGDVFDQVVEGNNAVSEEMRGVFSNARTLYADKLRPLLLTDHGLTPTDLPGLAATHAFRADDRLVKTLLLSAVAPEVPALRNLTGSRLASLNHGSIVSPLPGAEATLVLDKVRRWQGSVPEIHVGDDPLDPVVTVRIAEVDYESVVTRARGEDNEGRRRELLKRLVWTAFGLAERDDDLAGVNRHRIVWRGSQRDIEVLFGNVRDTSWLPDDTFRAGAGTWRFVVDYPFDDGHSSREDLTRLDGLKARLTERTIGWVPRFLSRQRRRDLGRLVILDWLLGDSSGERWSAHADNLAELDRAQARSILESQRTALRERISRAVQEAYGAASPTPGSLERDDGHDRVLVSLHPEFGPEAPVGHDLTAAFGNLIDQAFTATYPGHPHFEPEDREVRVADLAAVLDAVQAAQSEPDGRAAVEPGRREQIRRVANALQVGYLGENTFVFATERFGWEQPFTLGLGRDGLAPTDPVDVAQARAWIDGVEPRRGLRRGVSDLVICAWAVLHNRAWYLHGAPLVPAPKPGSLTPEMQLRPEPLPDATVWTTVWQRAGAIFGLVGNHYLTGPAVAELAEALRTAATTLGHDVGPLVERLLPAYTRLGLDPQSTTGRLATARAGQAMLARIRDAGTDRIAVITAVATADLPATDQAVGRSLTSAGAVAERLDSFAWERLDPLRGATGSDDRSRRARAVLDAARAALLADEMAQPLGEALRTAEAAAFRWLAETGASPGPRPGPPVPPPPPPAPDTSATVTDDASLRDAVASVRAFVAAHPGRSVTLHWRLDP